MTDLYVQLHAYIMDADRIPYALFAILFVVIVGMITGPFAGNANPFLWQVVDFLFGRLGERLDRPQRPRADLILRGLFLCIFGLILFLFLGRIAGDLAIGFPAFGAMEVLFLSFCLASGSVWFVLLKLYFALEKVGEAKGAYYGVSRSTRVNLNSTDDYGIVRTGMGFSAVSFDKGLVAPVFWYLIGGLPLVFVFSCVSAFAWRFGRNGHGSAFGAVALMLDQVMGIVPSLLAGFLFMASSALTPTSNLMKSFGVWWAGKGKAPYAEGGVMLAAMAWPLRVSLGGPVIDLGGVTLKNKWVGPDGVSAKLEYGHLRRGIYMNVIAHLLFVAALGGAYLFSAL